MSKTQTIDIREALRQAIDEEMQRDESVFLMGEEVGEYNGAYKVSKGLLDKYSSRRVIDTPISENGFSGIGVGAAMTGLRPIIEFMSFNFSFVAADQLISNACKMHYMSGNRFSVPIVFRGPNGAASQVACQHSHCVESMYANFPGFIIVSPSNAYDSKGLLKSSIRNNNPVLFLENELIYSKKMEIPTEEFLVPIGSAKVVIEGNDLTLISYSKMIYPCIELVKEFAKKEVKIELIDLRTIKPLDIKTIVKSIKKTNKCVIVEEGHAFSGISSEICYQIQDNCFDFLDAPVQRVCQIEAPLAYSRVLEKSAQPNKDSIRSVIEKVLL